MLSDLVDHGPVVRTLRRLRGPLELHCVATGAGYERRANETYNWEGSKRGAFAVIQHTIAGRGELDFAGTRHALRAGDTMLLTFPHANRYWLEPGQSWEYFWIGIQGAEGLRVARAILHAIGPVLRPSSAQIDRLADACLALATRELPVGDASAAAYAATMALCDAAFGDALPANAEHPLPVRRAETYVEENLAANLSVDRLARAAKLSRAHFVRLFSRSVGVSPSAYVFGQRMELAERLLLATDATVEAIARSCGFADGNYFAKAFRRANGQAPSAFRSTRLGRPTR
ncbi:MAG: helix-turn-helix transcriptional regulator [Devosia nanyangense]|uniref:Helix-turn-helix transcriptional regulator n=1 Tax=Devosia nanyangense TaxID=1228055 RepID=A0A933L4U0_9HYPH|nr:helix-turn-helix transcriptional regulator [Devosia nanyangense]